MEEKVSEEKRFCKTRTQVFSGILNVGRFRAGQRKHCKVGIYVSDIQLVPRELLVPGSLEQSSH